MSLLVGSAAAAVRAGRGETTDAAAIVAHVASVFRDYPDEALSWLRCESASGNLRTREGESPFVVGRPPRRGCCSDPSRECGVPLGEGCLLAGDAEKAKEALAPRPNRKRKIIATRVRNDLLVGVAVKRGSFADYAEGAEQSVRK